MLLTVDLNNLAAIAGELERVAEIARQIAVEPTQVVPAPVRLDTRGRIAFIRTILRKRRDFENRLGNDLFADGARDMLLDLYACELEDRRVFVSDLGLASAVPATTALRQMTALTDRGMLVREADPTDGRRAMLALAPHARRQIEEWLDGTFAAISAIPHG